jgi:hypothetical protein
MSADQTPTPADLRAKIARQQIPLYELAALVRFHASRLGAALNGRIPMPPDLAIRIQQALEKALERLRRQPDRTKDRRATIKAELPLLEARMRTLVDEIARGYATDTLRAELHDAEQRKKALVAELEALTGRRQEAANLDVERLRRELRRHVVEIRGLLGKDIPRTRQILRRLLVGRLECEAFDEGQRVGHRFTARGSYAALLPAALSTPEMVTRRDSNALGRSASA